MRKVIRNVWEFNPASPFAIAHILAHDIHPEGLDVDRIKFIRSGTLSPNAEAGHLLSVLRGRATLSRSADAEHPLQLQKGVHLFLPLGARAIIHAETGTELLCVSSESALQSRGKQLLVRDETFLSACAAENLLLRWTITPQYLSRRIFLHHDPILLSKSGNPVSWFHTTMFDVTGLPNNEDGEPVFKMAYNNRTEFNVCYEVEGSARVRMAEHPYSDEGQYWGPWLPLDDNSTYHLNEVSGDNGDKCCRRGPGRTEECLRNKHEVHITAGYVSLFCMFDPAPIGMERHQPGEYSDYEPMSQALGTRECGIYYQEIAKYDEMVDILSLARAKGELEKFAGTPTWDLYLKGRESQVAIEKELIRTVALQCPGREEILAPWLCDPSYRHLKKTLDKRDISSLSRAQTRSTLVA